MENTAEDNEDDANIWKLNLSLPQDNLNVVNRVTSNKHLNNISLTRRPLFSYQKKLSAVKDKPCNTNKGKAVTKSKKKVKNIKGNSKLVDEFVPLKEGDSSSAHSPISTSAFKKTKIAENGDIRVIPTRKALTKKYLKDFEPVDPQQDIDLNRSAFSNYGHRPDNEFASVSDELDVISYISSGSDEEDSDEVVTPLKSSLHSFFKVALKPSSLSKSSIKKSTAKKNTGAINKVYQQSKTRSKAKSEKVTVSATNRSLLKEDDQVVERVSTPKKTLVKTQKAKGKIMVKSPSPSKKTLNKARGSPGKIAVKSPSPSKKTPVKARESPSKIMVKLRSSSKKTPVKARGSSGKIMLPLQSPTKNERYPMRNRFAPMEWWRNERVQYERDGLTFTAKGVNKGEARELITDFVTVEEKRTPHKTRQARRSAELQPETAKKLNWFDSLIRADTVEVKKSPKILVLNTETGEEEFSECIQHRESYKFHLSEGLPHPDDLLAIAKPIQNSRFAMGYMVLGAKTEKGIRFVDKDSIIFYVKYGTVAVTIHHSTTVLRDNDSFYVPEGNAYNIVNLTDFEAEFIFFQLKMPYDE